MVKEEIIFKTLKLKKPLYKKVLSKVKKSKLSFHGYVIDLLEKTSK